MMSNIRMISFYNVNDPIELLTEFDASQDEHGNNIECIWLFWYCIWLFGHHFRIKSTGVNKHIDIDDQNHSSRNQTRSYCDDRQIQ